MIIETSDNRLFSVLETGNPDLAHVWHGLEVKQTPAGWAPKYPEGHKRHAKLELVRKAGSIVREI